MKPLILYHDNCMDGFGAAFAAWRKFGDEAEYLPVQYGNESYLNMLAKANGVVGRDVYVLDFSFPKEDMLALFGSAKYVVWLDHHKTAFEMWCIEERELHRAEDDRGYIILDNNKSGAMLAWEYFNPDTEVPVLFKHIDDHDRWQFKLPGTKEITKAIWSYAPWTFEMWRNEFLYGDNGSWNYQNTKLIDEGAGILRAHNQNVQAVVKGAARKCVISDLHVITRYESGPSGDIAIYAGGPKGLAANCPPHLSSDVGHALATASGSFGLLWYINKDGKCFCSLRSNGEYDVSAIAKKFGGGGHRNAAGFEVPIETLLGWIR